MSLLASGDIGDLNRTSVAQIAGDDVATYATASTSPPGIAVPGQFMRRSLLVNVSRPAVRRRPEVNGLWPLVPREVGPSLLDGISIVAVCGCQGLGASSMEQER